MEKYKIESEEELKMHFSTGKLKEKFEKEFLLQDNAEKASLSEAQPSIN